MSESYIDDLSAEREALCEWLHAVYAWPDAADRPIAKTQKALLILCNVSQSGL